MSRPMPPSGAAPPTQAHMGADSNLQLAPLAREICRRYMSEFPDEDERYGDVANEWCVHDNQYLLAWAIQDARDKTVRFVEQALWLHDVLFHRGFPVERLARDLEIAAELVGETLAIEPLGAETVARLRSGAVAVREAASRARND